MLQKDHVPLLCLLVVVCVDVLFGGKKGYKQRTSQRPNVVCWCGRERQTAQFWRFFLFFFVALAPWESLVLYPNQRTVPRQASVQSCFRLACFWFLALLRFFGCDWDAGARFQEKCVGSFTPFVQALRTCRMQIAFWIDTFGVSFSNFGQNVTNRTQTPF